MGVENFLTLDTSLSGLGEGCGSIEQAISRCAGLLIAAAIDAITSVASR